MAALKISYKRWNDAIEAIEETLSAHPEIFPVLAGTRLSICKSNEFFGSRFPGIPLLAIYFHDDEKQVYLISIEESDLGSYGL